MHFCSKQSEYRAVPEKNTSTNSSHKGKFWCFLFWLTLQSTQLKEIHMWIQLHLVHHLICLLYLRQLQLCKPGDGIRGHRCKQGTNLACKTYIIGDNRWDGKEPTWFSNHRPSMQGWEEYPNVYLNGRIWDKKKKKTYVDNKYVFPVNIFPFLPFTEPLSKVAKYLMKLNENANVLTPCWGSYTLCSVILKKKVRKWKGETFFEKYYWICN